MVKRPPPPPAAIEVGDADDNLPLWLRREAVRHGKVLLGAQHNNLVAMEARASSILSWNVPTIIALGAVALHGPLAIAAVVAAVFLFVAAIACVVALWPRLRLARSRYQHAISDGAVFRWRAMPAAFS